MARNSPAILQLSKRPRCAFSQLSWLGRCESRHSELEGYVFVGNACASVFVGIACAVSAGLATIA
jgi:hypothetical protein